MTHASENVRLGKIADMLASSLGKEKAAEVVAQHAQAMGITGETCSTEEAMQMLESMAKADGLLGIVARFAKARWHLSGGAK